MSNPILVFHAGTQVGKFRFLLYFSVACLVGSIVAFYRIAFVIEDVELTNPERWLLALIVLAAGVAFIGGMLIYSHRYVVWLWVDENLREVDIETVVLFGRRVRRFSVEAFASVKYDALAGVIWGIPALLFVFTTCEGRRMSPPPLWNDAHDGRSLGRPYCGYG